MRYETSYKNKKPGKILKELVSGKVFEDQGTNIKLLTSGSGRRYLVEKREKKDLWH